METKDEKKYKEYTKKTRNRIKELIRKSKQQMERGIAKNAKQTPIFFGQYSNSKKEVQERNLRTKY